MSQTSSAAAPRKRKFTLKLAGLGKHRWQEMPDEAIGGWTTYPESGKLPIRPGLLDQAFGERCEYGALLAYLFRRFGYPNIPSDPLKDIAEYALTTPLPDLILVASPSVLEWPRRSLRFLVTEQTWNRLEIEPHRHWSAAMVAWREAQGPLPDWMDHWLAFWRTKPGADRVATGERSDWALSVQDMHMVDLNLTHGTHAPDMPAEQLEMLRSVAAFVRELTSDFEAIKPNPRHLVRDPDWQSWSDDDPLKPYYAAAAEALKDLSTPVRVRDCAINAHGIAAETARIRDEPEVTGYGFGRFINQAPKAAIKLLADAEKLGNGNLAKGATMLLAGAERARQATHRRRKAPAAAD